MIRLIIALIGILMLWVWFAAPFKRSVKTVLTVISMGLSVFLIAYETYDGKPRSGLIEVSDIQVCAVEIKPSYRSDYALTLCVQNTQDKATVKRIQFELTASQCANSDECHDVETVTRDLPVVIGPEQRIELQQTLRFDELSKQNIAAEVIKWSARITEVQAVP